MIVTTDPLESRQIAVTIVVDDARTQQAMRRAARQIAREVRIPGFRKGKAPFDVIVQRFGEGTVRREAADLLAEDVVREALEQEEIEAYAPGELTEFTLTPLTYKLTVPLAPTVDLGDYRSYRLKPKRVRVTKKKVQEALERIRDDNTIFESVERPSKWDDGLALDLEARAGDGTVVLQGDGLHMLLEAGSTDPVPGFAEAIVGVAAGEERTFSLTLPPDFPQEAYREQDADFIVTVNDVYLQIIPDLDDDLARTVGSFESLKELEDDIRDKIRQASRAEQDREYANRVVQAIIEQAQVEFPPMVLEQELDGLVKEVERSIKREGRLSLEDYLRIQGQTMEELREELSPRAAARVTQALVLGEVVRVEELAVAEEEIGTGIEQASAPWGSRAEQVRTSFESEAGRRAMRSRLLADKAVQHLVSIAKGEVEQVDADADTPAAIDEVEKQAEVALEESDQEISADVTSGEGPDSGKAVDSAPDDSESAQGIEATPPADAGDDEVASPAADDQEAAEARDAPEAAILGSSEAGESE